MILTDEEVDSRILSPENLMNKLGDIKESHTEVLPMRSDSGRANGTIPSRVRTLLGVVTNMSDEKQTEIAKVFDVSSESLSNYSRGLVVETVDEELKEKVETAKAISKGIDKSEVAHDAALDVMVISLNNLKDKLHEVDKPKDLARIASDMSKISSNLKGKDKADDVNNTQVIIYAPQQRNENHYETITA